MKQCDNLRLEIINEKTTYRKGTKIIKHREVLPDDDKNPSKQKSLAYIIKRKLR